jgi:hypothetical protein
MGGAGVEASEDDEGEEKERSEVPHGGARTRGVEGTDSPRSGERRPAEDMIKLWRIA